jgi:uncharacterized delta-60 repeat protein
MSPRHALPLPRLETLEQRRLLSAGDLDPAFGVAGRTSESLSHLTFGGEILVLSNDRLLTHRYGFYDETPAPHQYELRRYNPDGTPDVTFGSAGIVVASLGPEGDSLTGQLREQADGRILAIGRSGTDHLLVRFNPDGTLDSTFDGDGLRRIPQWFNKYDVGPGGTIYFATPPDNNGVGHVYRLRSDGSTDTTFGAGGVATYAGLREFNAMAIAADGKIVLGGNATVTQDKFQFAVIRLNADGSLDTSFGGDDGIVVAPVLGLPRSNERVDALALLPNGQILAAGDIDTWDDTDAPSAHGIAALRLSADGTVDESFNEGTGVTFIPFVGSGGLIDLELDNQARPILVGYQVYGPVTRGLFAVRLLPDGAPDPAFGQVITDTPRSLLHPLSAGLQSNGRLVVGMSQETYVKRDNHHYFTGGAVITLGILTEDPASSPITLDTDTGVVAIRGTDGADLIDVTEQAATLRAVRHGFGRAFDSGDVRRVSVSAGAGDDRVALFLSSVAADATGGDGSDHIAGGDRNDTLLGGAGRDFIDGGLGADRIVGNGGNDQLRGQGGADHVYGRAGNDRVDGNGGNDLLDGGGGSDTLRGGGGDDRFASADGIIDELFGDGGSDTADADEKDLFTSIESTA